MTQRSLNKTFARIKSKCYFTTKRTKSTKLKDRKIFFRGGFPTRLNHTLRELRALRG